MLGDVTAPRLGYIRRASQESLRRLGADRIDLYQLHLGRLPLSQAGDLIGTLERGEQWTLGGEPGA